MAFLGIILPICIAHGQALEELKLSEAYQNLANSAPESSTNLAQDQKSGTPLTNYDSIWQYNNGARLLAQWVDVKLPNHRVYIASDGTRGDCASVEVTARNRQDLTIEIVIQVPKPQYKAMAQLKTLASFNRFRPPSLAVEGSQKVEIQGIQADYFRIEGGSCSLLIPIEQQGIINLRVARCTDSVAMIEVAKLLNISRLNQKLTS